MDDTLQMTFSNAFFLELHCCILIKIPLKFVSNCSINNIPTLVRIVA